MRIGIIGVHGTGKTTLAIELSLWFNLHVITERARAVAGKMGIKHTGVLLKDKDLARQFQTAVLLSQLAAEDSCNGSFVSDRTAVDCLAYWRLYGLEEDAAGDTYRRQCLSRPYDLLVYVPPEIPVFGDGFRMEDEASRVKADKEIRRIISDPQRFPSPVITVSGPIKDRTAIVVQELCRKGAVLLEPAEAVEKYFGA